MKLMNQMAFEKNEKQREKLENWATQGLLYALMDPFFEIPLPLERMRLQTKDTDPVFYDVIAWDQVTYEPPFMTKISPAALGWILNSLSTERWGVFIVSNFGLDALTRHFQKFVIARGPDANPYFLRFHDASVLTVLLNTWEAREKAVFFGAAIAIGLPDLDTMEIRLEANPFGIPKSAPLPEDCLLQLRDPQLRMCGEAIDRDLVRVIYWHLRNHHAKAVQFLEKAVLERRIEFAMVKARRYALGTVADLAGFTALMFELAPNFDEHPSFKAILIDSELPGEMKLRKMSQVITEREWQEAMGQYDRSYWQKVIKK